MSGSELAQRVGVTRQHIQRIETGKSAASDTVWVRIADALGVKVDDIFSHQQRQAS